MYPILCPRFSWLSNSLRINPQDVGQTQTIDIQCAARSLLQILSVRHLQRIRTSSAARKIKVHGLSEYGVGFWVKICYQL